MSHFICTIGDSEAGIYKEAESNNDDGYGHFYAVKSKSFESGQYIHINFGYWGYVNTYNCEFSIKIHKK